MLFRTPQFRVWNALLIAGVALCCASPALAAKQSLVNIVTDIQCCGAKGAFYSTSFPSEVITIGSTTPVSSIMIPANRLTVQKTSTVMGPFTPIQTNVIDRHNLPGTFAPGNPNAPPSSVTFSAASSTTLCTVSPVYTMGSCAPRYGLAKMSPTATKFGGTLRILDDGFKTGQFKSAGQTFSFYYQFDPTARLLGPMYVGGYGIAGSGKVTPTDLPTAMYISSFQTTEGPFTTGAVYVYHSQGSQVTKVTSTGYDNRTPTANGNVMGTVSLVRPVLTHVFLRDSATGPVFDTGPAFGILSRVRITFLPEPAQVLSIGCCVLALGALYRSRGK